MPSRLEIVEQMEDHEIDMILSCHGRCVAERDVSRANRMNPGEVLKAGAALESASVALGKASQAQFACRADRVVLDVFCAGCVSRDSCTIIDAYEKAAHVYDGAYAAYHDATKLRRSIV